MNTEYEEASMERSTYLFTTGHVDVDAVLSIPGVRAVAELADLRTFIGVTRERCDWPRLMSELHGGVEVLHEPIPDYPPSWPTPTNPKPTPTRIVWRNPEPKGYLGFEFVPADLWDLAMVPSVEEASQLKDGRWLLLHNVEWSDDLPTTAILVVSWAYDESEALVAA